MGRASWTGVGSVVRADRKVGGTVETPARYQGGRESKSCLCNALPPLVPTTGETACPTLGFMTVSGPQAHCDRAEALAPRSGLRKLRNCSSLLLHSWLSHCCTS